ncbi:MAG: VWA domain-containing protein [Chloroflexota bacterium]|nr:VWA domain-containing protein [Chloroflexota bacterium]
MPYDIMATGQTPALIIYLLDISASMSKPLGAGRRIDVVIDALSAALRQMIYRSTKGTRIAPRYRVALYAYSDVVYDLLGGARPVNEIASLGVPDLSPLRTTETAKAFLKAEELLQIELPTLQNCPAPLICHMTDAEYHDYGGDPEPIAQRIMRMRVPDGPVLIENIFVSENILPDPITDPFQWPGVTASTPLTNPYAQKLRALSSAIPESYRAMLMESGYHLAPGALMLLPGTNPEMVGLGFQMSTSTRA